MDEAKMTDADMAQREKIVKSMKKNFKDFRSRYGANAKNVMYATATKMAMKEEETHEALFYNPSPSHSPKAKNPEEKMSPELRKKMNYFRKRYGAKDGAKAKEATKMAMKEDAIEENKYSLPAGSMKPETPAKPKSYLEKRFGHLKPGESASLKGDPKEVKKPMKEDAIEEGEVKKANKEKKNAYVASIIQKKLHPSVLPSTEYGRRKLKEEHPLQGSSVAKVPYKEMDMMNIVQDAIKDIPEDDGPHTSDVGEAPNFTTVAKPEDVVNQANSEGNRDTTMITATRKSGKPFKTFRARNMSYGPEDLSGAVASVAIGEAVKDKADEGEYDYEGDMAKSSLRTIIRNAQMMHDMLDENTNLPEWVASKVTLAEDYIVAAAQYMQSEMSEEVELDEISSYKASRAADASWHMNTRGGQPAAQGYKKLRHVDTHPVAGKDGKLGSKSREKSEKQYKKFSDYAKKKIEMGEANLTPYRNTELGARSTKRAGQPRSSNSRQFFRPPEGFTKKGIEKGKGVVTSYHYKKKSSNTPTGAKVTMGGVDVHMGTSKATKRRKKDN